MIVVCEFNIMLKEKVVVYLLSGKKEEIHVNPVRIVGTEIPNQELPNINISTATLGKFLNKFYALQDEAVYKTWLNCTLYVM
jgi:hypothetical protein